MKKSVAVLVLTVFGLVGCSSSKSSEQQAKSDNSSTTASASGDGAKPTNSRDLCSEVKAADVAAILGEEITGAKPLSAGERYDSQFNGPTCSYPGKNGLGGAVAQTFSATRYEGEKSSPLTGEYEPMAGVGDEAFLRYDAQGQAVISTVAKKGNDYWYIQIFRGTTPDKAAELTRKILG
ncbi:MAG: DUF3558 domain-containing protein [Acidimicrobiales bacterium]|nr:DUF3558 domain-containing protein [Acidimicrobiales bacterium]